jgi:S1-C subfamily serine protease
LAINGKPTASWNDFFQARRGCAGRLTVRVFRQGAEFEVTMELPAKSRSPREVLEELRRDSTPAAPAARSELN